MNGYFRFLEEKMEVVKKANPNLVHKEATALIAKMYNDLDEAKKSVYSNAYAKDKLKYAKNLEEYEKKYGKVPKKERKS